MLTSSDIDNYVKMDIGLLQNCDKDLFQSNSVKQSDTGKGCEKGFVRKCHTNFFIYGKSETAKPSNSLDYAFLPAMVMFTIMSVNSSPQYDLS